LGELAIYAKLTKLNVRRKIGKMCVIRVRYSFLDVLKKNGFLVLSWAVILNIE
jgi:hypothetical protein